MQIHFFIYLCIINSLVTQSLLLANGLFAGLFPDIGRTHKKKCILNIYFFLDKWNFMLL